ncbi:MAG: radical SAM protein [Acidobacteriota bacterium]
MTALPRLIAAAGSIATNRAGDRRRPRLLTYTVTFKCNARCQMCDSWKLPGQGDLTLPEIESIFRQLPRLDAVRLTGGEPFVRKDLPEILALAQDLLDPMLVHVTTNGFLTNKIVALCEGRDHRRPLQVLVSIDGLAETHDDIRGRDGAFDSCLATLQELAPRTEELNLDLAVNQTVVDEQGIDESSQLRELLAPLGVRHQVVLAYKESATYHLERDRDVAPDHPGAFEPFGKFEPKRLLAAIDEWRAATRSLPWKERLAKAYYLDGLRDRLSGAESPLTPPCVALHSHLRLFPNGDVPTCQFSTKVVGNLREQRFDEVWNGVVAEERRRWVRACPGCWAECEVLPSAIYTGDLLLSGARR